MISENADISLQHWIYAAENSLVKAAVKCWPQLAVFGATLMYVHVFLQTCRLHYYIKPYRKKIFTVFNCTACPKNITLTNSNVGNLHFRKKVSNKCTYVFIDEFANRKLPSCKANHVHCVDNKVIAAAVRVIISYLWCTLMSSKRSFLSETVKH